MTTFSTWTERGGDAALAFMLLSMVAGMVGFLVR